MVLITVEDLCNSHRISTSGLLTCCCGLQHECDDAEEVDIGIVHSELKKDCLGVHVKPGVLIKVLKGSTAATINEVIYRFCTLKRDSRLTVLSYEDKKDKSEPVRDTQDKIFFSICRNLDLPV